MDSYAITPRFLVDLSPDIQNLMHAPCFGLLALLGLLTFRRHASLGKWAFSAAVGTGAFCFSALLEAAQAFVPGRTASLSDMIFNALGIAAALLLWPLIPNAPTPPIPHCPNDLVT